MIDDFFANVPSGQANSKSPPPPLSARRPSEASRERRHAGSALTPPRANSPSSRGGEQLRGRSLGVEVLQQKLCRLAEVRVGQLVIGRGESCKAAWRSKAADGQAGTRCRKNEASAIDSQGLLIVFGAAAPRVVES